MRSIPARRRRRPSSGSRPTAVLRLAGIDARYLTFEPPGCEGQLTKNNVSIWPPATLTLRICLDYLLSSAYFDSDRAWLDLA